MNPLKTISFLCAFQFALFAKAADKPPIILVMADDQGWAQMGYMNHPHLKGRMPHLDAMAEAGLRFNRFYAARSRLFPDAGFRHDGPNPRPHRSSRPPQTAVPSGSMLPVVDGESIAPLFDGRTPKRSHPIPFTMKGTALIAGNLKLLKIGRGKAAKWALFDLAKDSGEKKDISGDRPEKFVALKAAAEKITASVEASADGKDYPGGKVLQPQRGKPWMGMPEYQKLYPTFQKLKPSWNPPGKGKSKSTR